jgi:ubiquinone/menaquinone biosynthesis C-methylase UbiE
MSEDLSGTAFGDVDRTGYAQAFIPYLDAASQQFRSLKGSSHEALGLQAGDRVLDVGCGVGDDLRELASLVGPHGYAAGLDSSHNLVEEARRRASVPGAASAEFRVGDVHALPWGPDTFTACRADRVLQHVRDPRAALAEMVRVTRPGGRVLVIDRDWDLVAVDADDRVTTRAVLRRIADGIRNGWIGRHLHALFRDVGLASVLVRPISVELLDFDVADRLLDQPRPMQSSILCIHLWALAPLPACATPGRGAFSQHVSAPRHRALRPPRRLTVAFQGDLAAKRAVQIDEVDRRQRTGGRPPDQTDP